MGKTDLRVLGDTPFNAEPRSLVELTRHPITPLHLVYARNHCMFLPNYATASPISHNAPPDSDSQSLHATKSDDAPSSSESQPSDFRSPILGFSPDAADEMTFVASVAEIKNLASDVDTYTVKIDGEMEGMEEKTLSMKDMMVYFPRKEVVATLIVRSSLGFLFRTNSSTTPFSALVTVVPKCKKKLGKKCEVFCGPRVPSRMPAGRVHLYVTY